jgi:hypothetical protein
MDERSAERGALAPVTGDAAAGGSTVATGQVEVLAR